MVRQEKRGEITHWAELTFTGRSGNSAAGPFAQTKLSQCALACDFGLCLDNTLSCWAHQNRSERSLSQKGKVLNHMSTSLLICVAQLRQIIDVTCTKQRQSHITKPNFT